MSKGRGRDGAKEQFWRELVSGFDRERTTVRQWCAEHGVSQPSFYGWRRELKRRDRERAPRSRPKQPVQLLPVTIGPPARPVSELPKAGLVIRLPGGTRLYVTVEQLRAVLDVLEARSC